MEERVDKEEWSFSRLEMYIKGNGFKISNTEMDMKNGLMVLNLMENLHKAVRMEKESLCGLIAALMKGIL